MKFVARAAFGMFLLAVAAPTTSYADDDPYNAMNYYNQKNAERGTAANRARGRNVSSARQTAASKTNTPAFRPFAGHAGGNPHWINVARQYKGTNPTKRKSLWCADFLNLVLEKSGMPGTSSSMAKSFASYGRRLSGPQVGAIAVISRGKTAGHVGIVTGIDASGNPIVISGNHNNTVAEATYPRGRVMAYVWPTNG
jgi:uncharacterized protein (TIGR02594 family)